MKDIKDFISEPVTEARRDPDRPTKTEDEAVAELKKRIETVDWDNELYYAVVHWIQSVKEDIAGNDRYYVLNQKSGAWVSSWGTDREILETVAEKLKAAKFRARY